MLDAEKVGETARHVLDYTGGVLVMPMTVLVEQYWREISTGLARHDIPLRLFVLHADQDVLRERIRADTLLGPSDFAEVIDTTHLTPAQVARQVATALTG